MEMENVRNGSARTGAKPRHLTRRTNEQVIIDQTVGRNLRDIRSARGLTQADLAKILGVTYQQVQKYEAGARLSAGNLVQLARGIDVSIHEFFRGLKVPHEMPSVVDSHRLGEIESEIERLGNIQTQLKKLIDQPGIRPT